MSDKLVNVKADTVEEFMDGVSSAVGEGDGVMGLTTYAITPKFTLVKDKITKVSFEVKISVKRAHWSGGKADANNKKAIQAAEDLNKKHEAKHRKLAEDICAREFPKAVKSLKGQAEDDLNEALAAIQEKIDKAYADLDKKEGVTDVKANSNGSFTVKQVGL